MAGLDQLAQSFAMAPKKSESSTAAGAGINAARKVAAHVPSPPEGDPSGPQPKVRAQAPRSRTRYFRFDAAADRLVQTDAFGRPLGGGEGQPQQTPRMPPKAQPGAKALAKATTRAAGKGSLQSIVLQTMEPGGAQLT